jgi:hypothetical protein
MSSKLLFGVAASWLLISVAHATTFQDLEGDLLENAQPPYLDLTSVSADVHPDHVFFSLTFSDTTDPSDIPLLSGTIELDVDQNPGTGQPGTRLDDHGLEPRIDMGVDYQLEFISGSPNAGFVYVDPSGSIFGLPDCPWTLVDRTITMEVPRSYTTALEGLLLDSAFDMLVVVGNSSGPTDRAPNGASPLTVDIPEPAVALLMGLAVCLIRRKPGSF